jgi:amidase
LFNGVVNDKLSQAQLIEWQEAFRFVQGHEAWSVHGAWIRSQNPHFGPGIKERFEWASTIDDEQAKAARIDTLKNANRVSAYLEGAVICMPTVSYLAPQKGHASSAEDRTNAMSLLCIASLAGSPQITMPLAVLDGKAVGLSLLSRRFSDRQLLSLAQKIQSLLS